VTPAEPKRSRVLVFGGTGRTGRLIVEDALRDGHDVTVASRRPEALANAATLPAAARVVRAEVEDAGSVVAALEGQDAVFLAVSSPARHPGSLYSTAARNIVAAVEAAGVSRVIAISSGGVRQDDPALPFWYRKVAIPLFMKDLYDDMAVMEQTITASTLDWTIIRASYLQDRAGTGGYRVADATTPQGGSKLSRADLARFTVDQLSHDRWVHRVPTLAD
jgi:uncharacterized protein YbjT (DUF2867 family)